MEEEEDTSSPFWLPSTSQASHRRRRRSSSSSSFIFHSGVLLIFLLAIAVVFFFIVIPSIKSLTSQVFKPQLVKKSWDSLNLVLVLFAIICGFLSRSNNGNHEASARSDAAAATYEDYKSENRSESFPKSNPDTPRRFWYDHHRYSNNGGLSKLRSFSSHPDLKQEEALWVNRDDQWKFYDDTLLYNNRFSSLDHQWQPQPLPQTKLEEEEDKKEIKEVDHVDSVKNVGVDNTTSPVEESQKEIIYTPPPPLPLSSEEAPPYHPPPQTPQSKVVRRRVKRTNQENGGNYRSNDLEGKPSPPRRRSPSPPPPPPEPVVEASGGKSDKKRGGTSATKEFLTSLTRKKKKQRQKSVENLDSFFNYEASYPLPSSMIPPPSPTPPSPPPPPPPFFHNIFSSKKRKAKKIQSVIPSPPPPPPPPQPRTQKLSTFASPSKVERRNVPSTSQKPPLPIKSYSNVDDNVNSGNESPLNAIPPPPPLPPFKMSAWKFEVHGDYVRLQSNIGDEVEESSSPSRMDGGDSPVATPLFCPSPDVNTKADNFIARFRAGLRLEKMNSVNGRSNLGPEASQSQEGES